MTTAIGRCDGTVYPSGRCAISLPHRDNQGFAGDGTSCFCAREPVRPRASRRLPTRRKPGPRADSAAAIRARRHIGGDHARGLAAFGHHPGCGLEHRLSAWVLIRAPTLASAYYVALTAGIVCLSGLVQAHHRQTSLARGRPTRDSAAGRRSMPPSSFVGHRGPEPHDRLTRLADADATAAGQFRVPAHVSGPDGPDPVAAAWWCGRRHALAVTWSDRRRIGSCPCPTPSSFDPCYLRRRSRSCRASCDDAAGPELCQRDHLDPADRWSSG